MLNREAKGLWEGLQSDRSNQKSLDMKIQNVLRIGLAIIAIIYFVMTFFKPDRDLLIIGLIYLVLAIAKWESREGERSDKDGEADY